MMQIMKKELSKVLAIVMVISMSVTGMDMTAFAADQTETTTEADNGFYADGTYEMTDYNEETGYYEIANAGQLYAFADIVNGKENADK